MARYTSNVHEEAQQEWRESRASAENLERLRQEGEQSDRVRHDNERTPEEVRRDRGFPQPDDSVPGLP